MDLFTNCCYYLFVLFASIATTMKWITLFIQPKTLPVYAHVTRKKYLLGGPVLYKQHLVKSRWPL